MAEGCGVPDFHGANLVGVPRRRGWEAQATKVPEDVLEGAGDGQLERAVVLDRRSLRTFATLRCFPVSLGMAFLGTGMDDGIVGRARS